MSQTAGVLSWAKELLVQRCVSDLKEGVVVDYETDGNHVGKYVRVGGAVSDMHWYNSSDTGISEKASTAAKARCDGWTVHSTLPSSCDVVGCTSDTVMMKLGDPNYAKSLVEDLRMRIRDNGLFFCILFDSGAIYRKVKVEGKAGSFSNPLFSISLNHDDDDDNNNSNNEDLLGPLSLTIGGNTKHDNLTILNLSSFLRLCESNGYEVVSCINVVEFIYTFFDVHPHSKLLHSYGVWKHSSKILPYEKQLMELYTTLILRKKEHPPKEVWATIQAGGQSVEEDWGADDYLVMDPYVDSEKDDDVEMDLDIPWAV
eukprot:TRINITY_DN17123_c0_g1_i1.p1 TRINITY_DN17123_c0_g1~~TRINITY_DN17123_c0_g1_i1.p1  ORF type:complete len:330 (+),score=60.03 TRINITY_DN17123_c0_g1_i1:49-990(+)